MVDDASDAARLRINARRISVQSAPSPAVEIETKASASRLRSSKTQTLGGPSTPKKGRLRSSKTRDLSSSLRWMVGRRRDDDEQSQATSAGGWLGREKGPGIIESNLAKFAGPLLGSMRVGVDQDAMKAQVRQNLLRPAYDVQQFYKHEGIWQHVARSAFFEHITLMVIALNSIWIWLDTDLNPSEVLVLAPPIFQVAEHMFIVFFLVEWTIRFASFQYKTNCCRDAWFVFDTFLVIGMVLEGWVVSILMFTLSDSSGGGGGGLGDASILRMARLLRLSRMARMVRLFRAMPELLILLKGMAAATRSVFFTLCLLATVLYVFGIAFRQLTDGTPLGKKHFRTVAHSMYTLLIDGTFTDNLGVVVRDIGKEAPFLAVPFWLFVLLSAMTVMNMLIGVLCEVVSAVAATEKESLAVNFVKDRMRDLFRTLDKADDDMISREEFLDILQQPAACKLLQETGVDVLGTIDQADAIFSETNDWGETVDKELGFVELMQVIMDLRGCNTAKVKNIVDLRRDLQHSISQTHKAVARLEVNLTTKLEALSSGKPVQAKLTSRASVPNLSSLDDAFGFGSEEKITAKSSKDSNKRSAFARSLSSLSPRGKKWSPSGTKVKVKAKPMETDDEQVVQTFMLPSGSARARDRAQSTDTDAEVERVVSWNLLQSPQSVDAGELERAISWNASSECTIQPDDSNALVAELNGLVARMEGMIDAAKQDSPKAVRIQSLPGHVDHDLDGLVDSLRPGSSGDPVPAVPPANESPYPPMSPVPSLGMSRSPSGNRPGVPGAGLAGRPSIPGIPGRAGAPGVPGSGLQVPKGNAQDDRLLTDLQTALSGACSRISDLLELRKLRGQGGMRPRMSA